MEAGNEFSFGDDEEQHTKDEAVLDEQVSEGKDLAICEEYVSEQCNRKCPGAGRSNNGK